MTYQVLAGEAATTADTSAATKVLQIMPTDVATALSVEDLATAAGVPERTVRHALDQPELGSQVERRGSGRRGDPYRFFIPATPNPQGLHEWNKQEGGPTIMAIRADQRGPPATDAPAHESAGAEDPGTNTKPITPGA